MGHYLAIGCTAHILQKLHILHYSVILSFRSLILCILWIFTISFSNSFHTYEQWVSVEVFVWSKISDWVRHLAALATVNNCLLLLRASYLGTIYFSHMLVEWWVWAAGAFKNLALPRLVWPKTLQRTDFDILGHFCWTTFYLLVSITKFKCISALAPSSAVEGVQAGAGGGKWLAVVWERLVGNQASTCQLTALLTYFFCPQMKIQIQLQIQRHSEIGSWKD